MPNLVVLSLVVSDKNVFKDFENFLVLLPWQPESSSFKKSEEDHGRNISVKFYQYQIRSFREEDV